MKRIASVLAALIAAAGSANAQSLLVGTGDFTTGAENDVFLIDLATGTASVAFTGFDIWGMTTDANGTVWFTANDGGLYTWSIGDTDPTFVDLISPNAPSTNTRFDGLGFIAGTLYGWQQFADPATGSLDGLYEIDLSVSPPALTWIGTNVADGAISGLDSDPILQDTLFAANDTNLQVQTINPANGAATFFAAYPAGENDLDAIAVGDGMAWLVEDEAGLIYEIDLASGTIVGSFPTPFTVADTFSGAAYIPGTGGGCSPADISSPANPGIPDGLLSGADFFEFLARFQIGDLSVDYSSPASPGVPDGLLSGADFFEFLNLFAQGC